MTFGLEAYIVVVFTAMQCNALRPQHKISCPTVNSGGKDPVCGMMVDENKARYVSDAQGKKVYLCSEGCKGQFDKDPGKYGY